MDGTSHVSTERREHPRVGFDGKASIARGPAERFEFALRDLSTMQLRLDARTIAFILQHGGAKLLIADAEFSDTVRAALALLPRPKPAEPQGMKPDPYR